MTKYIKGKDGKFAGSIGDGKTSVPTPAPSVPKVSKAEQKRLDYNEKLREMNERRAAMAPIYAARREQQENARQAWFAISDELNITHPNARWMILDDTYHLVGLTDRDNTVIADGPSVLSAHPDLAGKLATFEQHEDLQNGRYKKDNGHRVGIFFNCGEDGCTVRMYPEGFQPNHKASQYCRSGRRNHCTCDICF